jgi:hypothetical protein
MQACVIKPTHPSFDFWLALQLSTEDADEIPMFLDAYVNGEIDSTKDFIGHVQHFVLKIMESIILSNDLIMLLFSGCGFKPAPRGSF